MKDFTQYTEVSGTPITRDQLFRMVQRYSWASVILPPDSDVIELCCGTGQGLGILKQKCQSLTALDITSSLIAKARIAYGSSSDIKYLCQDVAEFSEVCDERYDCIIIFEAIYYMPNPLDIIKKLCFLLKPKGSILMSWPNPGYLGFTPSKHSHIYPDTHFLSSLQDDLRGRAKLNLFAASEAPSFSRQVKQILKSFATRYSLIPNTMSSKLLLKRVFEGNLVTMPPILSFDASLVSAIQPLPSLNVPSHARLLFAQIQSIE